MMSIPWNPTTENRYEEMLGVLPPAAMMGAGFLVGEPVDHDPRNGLPRYEGYRQKAGRYEVSSRPMTVTEFRREMAE